MKSGTKPRKNARPRPGHLEEVDAIVTGCHMFLGGKPPEIQGAALAELLATWLAGHVILDGKTIDRGMTELARHHALAFHIKAMHDLLPIVEEDVLARLRPN